LFIALNHFVEPTKVSAMQSLTINHVKGLHQILSSQKGKTTRP